MIRLRRPAVLVALLLLFAACSSKPPPATFPEISARDNPNDKGGAVQVTFQVPESEAGAYQSFRIERAEAADGPWVQLKRVDGGETDYEYVDESATLDASGPQNGKDYYYRVVAAKKDGEVVSNVAGPAVASTQWWDSDKIAVFLAVLVFSLLVWWFIRASKRDPDIYVRPIGGLAALSEAIGRATEMGKPVLYVPGIADMDDIQTITALVIMREVAQRTAEYETPIIVPCRSPVVMTAAEEAVRTGCLEAGKPDLFRRDNVRFLSDEQFAFTAATNGIMLREHPAANIYIGAFWAESLILAETGFLAGAIQIAGTANVSQLPFFVAACDYTLMGEEIYAASAYLSREPMLLGSLKGSDWAKVVFAVAILVGAVMASVGASGAERFIEFFK